MSTHIPVRDICITLLKQEVLDIFYLIHQHPNKLSQVDIKQIFANHDPDPEAKITKYRSKIETGIACLKAVLFIDSWRQGQAERYFLTDYGKEAFDILAQLFEEDPDRKMLLGSIIVTKYFEGKEEELTNDESTEN